MKKVYIADFDDYTESKKKKTIRFMLLVIEQHMDKNSREYQEIRNTILDSVNELCRDISLAYDSGELID